MSNPTEVAALITAANNLTQTVIDKRSEITSTVNAKIAQLDNWKASLTPGKLVAEPRYVSTIDLTGLSTDRYYPVWWAAVSGKGGIQRIVICRHYSDDQALDPFNTQNGNLAGLFLEIENIATLNSSLKYFTVVRLSQVLRTTVRNIRHGMRCANVLPADGHLSDTYHVQNKINPYRCGLYLRGGLTYSVISNYHKSLNYSREDGEVEIFASSTFTHKGRWMVTSYPIDDPFLGPEYDNFMPPYNPFPYDL